MFLRKMHDTSIFLCSHRLYYTPFSNPGIANDSEYVGRLKKGDIEIEASVDRALSSSDCDFIEALIIIKDNKIVKMLGKI